MSVLSELNNGLGKLERLHDRYFAQRSVLPWELPGIMRKHIYTGAMGSVWGTLIAGVFLVYFTNAIEMPRSRWGVFNGAIALLGTAQLFSAFLTQRARTRKLVWFYTAVGERVLRLAAILVAYGLWQAGSSHAAFALIGITCVAVVFGWMAGPPWYSWLGDIIPEQKHGRFWGRRSAWVAAAVVSVTVPAALLVDRIPPAWKVQTVLLIFSAGTLIGLIDLLIHGTIPEPAMREPEKRHFLAEILIPIRDRRFRPWLAFDQCWTFSLMLGATLATQFWMDSRHGGLALETCLVGSVIVLQALPQVGSILTSSWSGRLVDRIGIKPVLLWGYAFWSILPVLWVVAKPGWSALILLGLSSLIGGTSSAAAMTAANKLITRFPHPSLRGTYVAVDSWLANLASAAGCFVAFLAAEFLGHWHWTIAGRSFGIIHVLFLASMVLRLTATFVLVPRVRTPDEAPAAVRVPEIAAVSQAVDARAAG
jgi:hypothetical protein